MPAGCSFHLEFLETIAHGQKAKRVIIDYIEGAWWMGGSVKSGAGQTSGCYYRFVLSLTLAVPWARNSKRQHLTLINTYAPTWELLAFFLAVFHSPSCHPLGLSTRSSHFNQDHVSHSVSHSVSQPGSQSVSQSVIQSEPRFWLDKVV